MPAGRHSNKYVLSQDFKQDKASF